MPPLDREQPPKGIFALRLRNAARRWTLRGSLILMPLPSPSICCRCASHPATSQAIDNQITSRCDRRSARLVFTRRQKDAVLGLCLLLLLLLLAAGFVRVVVRLATTSARPRRRSTRQRTNEMYSSRSDRWRCLGGRGEAAPSPNPRQTDKRMFRQTASASSLGGLPILGGRARTPLRHVAY
jgi:hypothetical protein